MFLYIKCIKIIIYLKLSCLIYNCFLLLQYDNYKTCYYYDKKHAINKLGK